MSKHPRLSFRPKRPGPERVVDARERAYGPGRESRNPVTRSSSNSTETGGYWVPARRKPGVAGLAWPGMTTICDGPAVPPGLGLAYRGNKRLNHPLGRYTIRRRKLLGATGSRWARRVWRRVRAHMPRLRRGVVEHAARRLLVPRLERVFREHLAPVRVARSWRAGSRASRGRSDRRLPTCPSPARARRARLKRLGATLTVP
jgi:hypothetical protein